MVKAEERVAENRKLKEAIETATAEAERARGEAERARGEAAAAEAEVELMVAKVASAETDAGKELDALKEKFEKHKKFSDEKVRALAKAQSDVRALEGKLEDATRDLAAANEAARAERRREEEEDAAAKATSGGKDAAAKDKNNAGVQKDVDYPATAAKESQTDVDASIASTERTRTDASPPDGSESVDRNVQKEYDDVQKADEKRDERLTEEVDALRLSASASRLRIASLEEQEKVFAEAIASKSSQIQSLERSLEESNARLEEASERAASLDRERNLAEDLARQLEVTLAFNPLRFTTGLEAGVSPFELAEPLFGHMFLHGGIDHILFNSLWLLVFGAGVARRLGVDFGGSADRLYRNVLFLTFYLACGLCGVGVYYLLDPNSPVFLVGASGAISGLIGGAIRFITPPDPARGQGPHDLAPLISRPVMVVTLMFVLLNLGTALGVDSIGMEADIAWEAHLGGYFGGLLIFPLFDRLAHIRL